MGEVVQMPRQWTNGLIINTFVQAITIDDGKKEVMFVMIIKSAEQTKSHVVQMSKVAEILEVVGCTNSADMINSAIRFNKLELANYMEDKFVILGNVNDKTT